MEYVELGNTGVRIPEIGLGTSGYTGGDVPLQTGISLGASLIDTAEVYGTEGAVGEAIRHMRDKVFIATKVSPSHFKHDEVISAAENSLKRLGTDYIDLYQLHAPNPAIPIGETMSAMDQLVSSGKIRFIGVSNFSVADLEEAQAATENKIVSNQVRYSLADRAVEKDVIPYCRDSGVTVIAYSPLARGIGNIKAKLSHGALETVAEATGKTEVQVALNWCTTKANVVAIPKSDSSDHTRENCNASGWRLSPEQVGLLAEAR